jgi:hypothetical protein
MVVLIMVFIQENSSYIRQRVYIESKEVFEYPYNTRRKIEDYLKEGRLKLVLLLNNYNYLNKRKLVELIKLETS